jgi:hypothetical protein
VWLQTERVTAWSGEGAADCIAHVQGAASAIG